MTTQRAAFNDNAAGACRAPVSIYVGLAALAVGALVFAGCGPELPPSSLIVDTRVIGARVQVEGAPERASPAPGETATVTWLVTAPATTPPLGWAFALCFPGAPGKLDCPTAPLAVYQGTSDPPRVTVTIPDAATLGSVSRLTLYGRICAGAAPVFDASSGFPGCAGGALGTTAALTIALQETAGADVNANHNPVGDRGFTLDGVAWPAAALGNDPCLTGPRLAADGADHAIVTVTAGTDRQDYTRLLGDPPVLTAARESLQISSFATAGNVKVPHSFVEAAEVGQETGVTVAWTAPKADTVTTDTQVTFTFVTRDSRGGSDWTTRTACLAPQ